MSDSLTDLIFSLTSEDGYSIGNGAMMALLRERVPGLTDDDYFAARDATGQRVARSRSSSLLPGGFPRVPSDHCMDLPVPGGKPADLVRARCRPWSCGAATREKFIYAEQQHNPRIATPRA